MSTFAARPEMRRGMKPTLSLLHLGFSLFFCSILYHHLDILYIKGYISFVLNQSSVGGFTGCCTVKSDEPQVPYMVFAASLRLLRRDLGYVQGVWHHYSISQSLPAQKSAAAVGGSGRIYQKVKCSLCYKSYIQLNVVLSLLQGLQYVLSTYIMLHYFLSRMSKTMLLLKNCLILAVSAVLLKFEYLYKQ